MQIFLLNMAYMSQVESRCVYFDIDVSLSPLCCVFSFPVIWNN